MGEWVWSAFPLLRRGRGFRHRIVGPLEGRVLEIGFGHGNNFDHYNGGVESVWAIEPNPVGFQEASHRARRAVPPIHMIRAVAESLPFSTATFDAEARRVLKPSGTLRLLEHVRAPEAPLAWLQDRLTPPWTQLTGGCHLNRDTATALQQAGFQIVRQRRQLRGMVLEVEAHPCAQTS